MAMRCQSCGKGVMHGHNVSHAKNRTQKIFKPNLHSVRVLVGTTRKQLKLCVKCSRMFKKVEKAILEQKSSSKEVPAAQG